MNKESINYTIPSLRLYVSELSFENSDKYGYRDYHFHTEIELVLVEEGEITCNFNNEKVKIKENEILFINKNVIHHLKAYNNSYRFTYFQIDIEQYQTNCGFPLLTSNNVTCNYKLFKENHPIFKIATAIKNEIIRKESNYEAFIKGCIFQLTAAMCRENLINTPTPLKSLDRIIPALNYVEANLNVKINLETVSKLCNTDKYNFCKIFKKITGVTFISYLNKRRLKFAEGLLVKSSKNVTEIAFESGFASLQYFNRTFIKRYGISPTTYRKMLVKR